MSSKLWFYKKLKFIFICTLTFILCYIIILANNLTFLLKILSNLTCMVDLTYLFVYRFLCLDQSKSVHHHYLKCLQPKECCSISYSRTESLLLFPFTLPTRDQYTSYSNCYYELRCALTAVVSSFSPLELVTANEMQPF